MRPYLQLLHHFLGSNDNVKMLMMISPQGCEDVVSHHDSLCNCLFVPFPIVIITRNSPAEEQALESEDSFFGSSSTL